MCLPLHGRRKDHVHIEPKAYDFGELPRTGKHARGKAQRVSRGIVEPKEPFRIFPKNSPTKEEREARVSRSVHEGTSISDQEKQDRAVADFVKGLSGKDRAFAIECGLLKRGRRGLAKLADAYPSGPASEDGSEEAEEQEVGLTTGGMKNGRPLRHREDMVLDAMEPGQPAATPYLTDPEIARAHDDFGQVLAWVHAATHLGKKADRLGVLIAWCRPDLAESLPKLPGLVAELERLGVARENLAIIYGRVFAWAREAASLYALGIRANIIAYVVNSRLIDSATNAQIGALLNNTRAAINKLVGEFRDTFAGIRAMTMRDESTRVACRFAQFA